MVWEWYSPPMEAIFVLDLPSLWWVLLSRWPMAWRKRFSGEYQPMLFVAKLDRFFFVAFLLAHCLMFVFFTLTGEIIKFFHLQKKSTFFESGWPRRGPRGFLKTRILRTAIPRSRNGHGKCDFIGKPLKKQGNKQFFVGIESCFGRC